MRRGLRKRRNLYFTGWGWRKGKGDLGELARHFRTACEDILGGEEGGGGLGLLFYLERFGEAYLERFIWVCFKLDELTSFFDVIFLT